MGLLGGHGDTLSCSSIISQLMEPSAQEFPSSYCLVITDFIG